MHGGGSGERAGGDKGKEKRARSVSEDASELGHTPSAKKAKMIESGQEEADNAVSDDGSGLTDPPSDIDMQDGPGEREENKEPAEDEPEEDSSSDDDSDDDSSDGSWDRGPPLKPVSSQFSTGHLQALTVQEYPIYQTRRACCQS